VRDAVWMDKKLDQVTEQIAIQLIKHYQFEDYSPHIEEGEHTVIPLESVERIREGLIRTLLEGKDYLFFSNWLYERLGKSLRGWRHFAAVELIRIKNWAYLYSELSKGVLYVVGFSNHKNPCEECKRLIIDKAYRIDFYSRYTMREIKKGNPISLYVPVIKNGVHADG
jgi:hypothetical protein